MCPRHGRFGLGMKVRVDRAADQVERVAQGERTQLEEFDQLGLVAIAPRAWIQSYEPRHQRAPPGWTVVVPRSVKRYARRPSLAVSGAIRPRRSSLAMAAYNVPGPIGPSSARSSSNRTVTARGPEPRTTRTSLAASAKRPNSDRPSISVGHDHAAGDPSAAATDGVDVDARDPGCQARDMAVDVTDPVGVLDETSPSPRGARRIEECRVRMRGTAGNRGARHGCCDRECRSDRPNGRDQSTA